MRREPERERSREREDRERSREREEAREGARVGGLWGERSFDRLLDVQASEGGWMGGRESERSYDRSSDRASERASEREADVEPGPGLQPWGVPTSNGGHTIEAFNGERKIGQRDDEHDRTEVLAELPEKPTRASARETNELDDSQEKQSTLLEVLVRGPQALFQKGTGSLKKAGGFQQKPILITEQKKRAKEKRGRDDKKRHSRKPRHVHFKLPRPKENWLQALDPKMPLVEKWLMFMLLPLSFEVWAFPYRLAFGTPGDFEILLGDLICDGFIVFDIILMFCIKIPAYTVPHIEHDLTTFASIAAFRTRNDIPMRVLPPAVFYIGTFILWGRVDPAGIYIWFATSVPRLLARTYRLFKYFRGVEKNLDVSVRPLQMVKFSGVIFLSAHWIGCVFYFLSRTENFSRSTWIREFEDSLPLFRFSEAPRRTDYLLCLYKGFSTLSNLNYGLGLPKRRREMIWAIISTAIQIYINALILGTLLNFLVEKDPTQEKHKKQMADLATFMEAKNLPLELRERLQNHFNFQHQKNVQHRAAASITLPRSLQVKVADAKYKYIIDKCTDKGRTLYGCNMQFINSFLTRLKVMHVMASEEITKKGEIPRELWFVLDGAVHVVDDDNRVKRSIRNDVPDMSPIVGEVPFFLGVNHTHTIRARPDGDVQLLVLTRDESTEVFSTYPEEYEQINTNLLAIFNLTNKGEDLGAGGVVETDAEITRLKNDIIASMKLRTERRFDQMVQAVLNGDVEAVKMEVRQGADINQANYDGRTVLHMASEDGDYKMVEMLIEQKADLNAKDRWGQTPLAEAVLSRHSMVCRLLSTSKAELAIENSAAVLAGFGFDGNLEQVTRMVENRTDPNVKDQDLRSPLHVAAAEGKHKIVEYLLSQGAVPDALDRFGTTPLQNAVQNGKVLTSNILRATGATLPRLVGTAEMCQAAAKGDVNRLRLLHDCDVSLESHDYDGRTALCLSTSAAQLLAVSFLLGASANPNAKDRWGRSPLDEAFYGWTQYHKYCAKLIHGWGGRLGQLEGTEEGKQKMRELGDIDVDAIREVLRRLISDGQKHKPHTTLAKQEMFTSFDSSVALVPVICELRGRMLEVTSQVQAIQVALGSELGCLCSAVSDLTQALSTPVRRDGRAKRSYEKNVLGWRMDSHSNLYAGGSSHSRRMSVTGEVIPGQNVGLVMEIVKRTASLEHGGESEAEFVHEAEGFVGEGEIDSEEEDMLHAELDALMHAQELAAQYDSSLEAMAAKRFQEVALKVVRFGDTFDTMANACLSVRRQELAKTHGKVLPRALKGWMGKVSFEGLPLLLRLLRVDRSMFEIESIYDQASAYSRLNTVTSRGPDLSSVGEDEHLRLPEVNMEALLAGSSLFRQTILAMNIDTRLCSVMDTWIGRVLGEDNTRLLLVGSAEKTVKKGALVWDPNREPDLTIIISGEVSVTVNQELSTSSEAADQLSADEARPKNQILVGGDYIGAYAPLGLEYLPGISAIANRQCTVVIVPGSTAKEVFASASPVRRQLILQAGEAPVIPVEDTNATSLLLPKESPETRAGAFLRKIGGNSKTPVPSPKVEPAKGVKAVLNFARTWSWASVAQERPKEAQPEAVEQHCEPEQHLEETERMWIKDMVETADSLWNLLSMGQPTVARGYLLAVGKLLGEVSSGCFRKMFAADRANLPEEIDVAFFWHCWVGFLSAEVFGTAESVWEGVSEDFEFEDRERGEQDNPEQVVQSFSEEEEESDEEENKVLGRIHHRLDKSRWLRKRFFQEEVVEMYERSYLAVVGNLRDPLTQDRIPEFLMRSFRDFPHRISRFNVKEFLTVFAPNRNQASKATVTWADIRKILREHRLGVAVERVDKSIFINTVLNPEAHWMHAWFVVVKCVSVYHFIMMPVRATFLPWHSFLDEVALDTDLIVDFITFAHLIVMCNTAYQNSRSTWVVKRIKILNKVNWPSAFAAVPMDWFAYLCGASNEAACWLRMNKLFLLVTWGKYGWIGFARFRTQSKNKWNLMLVMVSMTLHIAACLWFFLGARYSNWNPNTRSVTWLKVDDTLANLTYAREDHFGLKHDAGTVDQYILSFYWVSSTLAVTGLVGDVIPQNYAEVIFAIVMMVLNMTLIRWIVGEVSSMIMGSDKKLMMARQELEAVDQFVNGNNLPEKLQNDIKLYFRASNAQGSNTVDQESLLDGMSHSLKVEVASFISREYLDGVELFSGCSERLLDALSVLLLEVSFAPEEFLFRASGPAKEMYFVVSGIVEELVEMDSEEIIEATKRAHSSVGGVAVFFGLRHLNSARAGKVTGTTCLRLQREQFFDLLKIYPADEEIIGNNATASLEVVEAQRVSSSHRSGSKRGGSVVSRDKSVVIEEEGSGAGNEAEVVDAAEDEKEEEQREIATNSGLDSDATVSDALEALLGSNMKEKINALKNRRKKQRIGFLMNAVVEGDADKCQRLIRGDLPVNSTDSYRRTALHVAASAGHLRLVKLLVELNGDVHLKDRFANTPFNDAVRHEHDSVVKFFRDTFPDIRLVLPGFQGAVLMCAAASSGNLLQIQRLVENGVNVNEANYDSRTALHVAASDGHTEICRYLLEAKAIPRCRDRFNGTPLADAVRERKAEVQQLMRDNGGNLGNGHGYRYCAMLCNYANEGDLDNVKVMVRNGVGVSQVAYCKRTGLHLAACAGRVSVLDYLLAVGKQSDNFEVNSIDNFGNTPLDDAIRHNEEAAMVLLKQHGGITSNEAMKRAQALAREASAKQERRPKVLEIVKHSPERRATDAVAEELIPGLKAASCALQEALAELSRRAATLTRHITGGRGGGDSYNDGLGEGFDDGIPALIPGLKMLPILEQTSSLGSTASPPRSPLPKWLDFTKIQQDAEAVVEQVKTLKQVGVEMRRLLEFGAGGSVEGIDCHMWKKIQLKFLMEAKGPARQLRKANDLCKLMAKLMKEIIKTAKGRKGAF